MVSLDSLEVVDCFLACARVGLLVCVHARFCTRMCACVCGFACIGMCGAGGRAWVYIRVGVCALLRVCLSHMYRFVGTFCVSVLVFVRAGLLAGVHVCVHACSRACMFASACMPLDCRYSIQHFSLITIL